jgi:putative oxidoreductase
MGHRPDIFQNGQVMIFKSLSNYRNFGLLILRVFVGVIFALYGTEKMLGGPELWNKIGSKITALHINFAPAQFWGFMAMLTEMLGGILLVVGFATRPVIPFMMFTMVVAIVSVLKLSDFFSAVESIAFPTIMLGVLLSLFIMGPGKFSVDHE